MVREPDLLIYLKSSVPHLVSQIQKRDEWIDNYPGRVLVIEADNLDFENRPEDFSQITDKIDAQLYGLF